MVLSFPFFVVLAIWGPKCLRSQRPRPSGQSGMPMGRCRETLRPCPPDPGRAYHRGQPKLTCESPGSLAGWTWFLPGSVGDPEHSALFSFSATLDLARRTERGGEWGGLSEGARDSGKGRQTLGPATCFFCSSKMTDRAGAAKDLHVCPGLAEAPTPTRATDRAPQSLSLSDHCCLWLWFGEVLLTAKTEVTSKVSCGK